MLRVINPSRPGPTLTRVWSDARMILVMLRIAAGLIDLLLVFFIGIGLVPFVKAVAAVFVAEVCLLFLYRHHVGVTPGQQLVGMRHAPQGVVVAVTNGVAWLRAAAALLLITWVGVTVFGGFFISRLTDEKLDPDRVAIVPVEKTLEEQPTGELAMWRDGISFNVPDELYGKPIDVAPCCVVYGSSLADDDLDPGVIIISKPDSHPFDYCGGVQGEVIRTLSGCRDTPLAFQQRVIEVTPSSRWSIWNPLRVARVNFDLLAKNIYLEDVKPDAAIERIRRADREIVWTRTIHTVEKPAETIVAETDHFLIADEAHYGGIGIIWKKTERDLRIAEMIASSLAFEESDETAIRREIERSAASHRAFHLMNAVRMSDWRPDVVEIMREALAARGTPTERRAFARSVVQLAMTDEVLRPLAATVEEWTGDPRTP